MLFVQLLTVLLPFLCASISLRKEEATVFPLLRKKGKKRTEIIFNSLLPPLAQEVADRDLRGADTRGSPPGSRDKRTAAWSQHSFDHSGRRMTCVAGGIVLYSLKCSHLHNLQGL